MGYFKMVGITLLFFGIIMLVILGSFGLVAGYVIGMSVGGKFLLAILVVSVLYIVVLSVMKIAVFEANPILLFIVFLVITFFFNIMLGILLFYYLFNFISG